MLSKIAHLSQVKFAPAQIGNPLQQPLTLPPNRDTLIKFGDAAVFGCTTGWQHSRDSASGSDAVPLYAPQAIQICRNTRRRMASPSLRLRVSLCMQSFAQAASNTGWLRATR
jgi:hypothetical protein